MRERKRMILPLHRTQDAEVQRMLNFFQMGTYVRPHRHSGKGAIETICVLRGALGFVVFDEGGEILESHLLDEGGMGILDIEPNIWHGMVALEPDTVILEIKRGPYSAMDDKDFAPWAPEEGDPAAVDVLDRIESSFC